MKTNALILIIATIFFSACGKKDSTTTNPPTADTYINTNTGSSWTYHEDDSSAATPKSTDYTLISTSTDTTINVRKYHVYSYSYGGSQYLNLSGNDYYQFDSIPGSGGVTLERLYLKDNSPKGTSWSQSVNLAVPGLPITIPLTITNTIAEKGISITVNGVPYNNVIHVTATISSASIPAASLTSSIDSYYTQNYGLIENKSLLNLNYVGVSQNVNIHTFLKSSVLK